MHNVWIPPIQANQQITFSINRNILFAIIVSLLLHLLVLWLFAPKLFSIGDPQKDTPRTLEVTLGPPQKEEVAPVPDILPEPEPLPPIPPKPIQPKPKPKVKQKQPSLEKPIATAKNSERVIPKQEDNVVEKPPVKQTEVLPLPGEDMQSYMRRKKVASLAKQGFDQRDIEEVLENDNPQSAGSRRDANIKKNLDLDGTNGIFEIRSLGSKRAQFSFKGWKNNVNTARLEIIDVTASNGEDIKYAVIRQMIQIIRREYSGDFNWDSKRLQRIIVLSARLEDTRALEEFMMQEFFGPGSQFR